MTCNSEIGFDYFSCLLGIKRGQTFDNEIGVIAVIIILGVLIFLMLMFCPVARTEQEAKK
jgi:hypothetical protein